jgi:hypothetical protein
MYCPKCECTRTELRSGRDSDTRCTYVYTACRDCGYDLTDLCPECGSSSWCDCEENQRIMNEFGTVPTW